MTPLKSNAFKIVSTSATVAETGFGVADKEIITYKAAKVITAGYKGAIQGHHLIEQRFLKILGMDLEMAPAVVLSQTEHKAMTNVLFGLIPKGTTNISKEMLINSYKIAYRNYPTWIKAVENYLK